MIGLVAHLVSAIEASGLPCAAAFSLRTLPLLDAPLVIVGESMLLSPVVFNDALGMAPGSVTVLCHQAEHTVLLDIYVPYRSGGYAVGAVIDELLLTLEGIPNSYRLQSIQVGQVYYEPESDCFRCTLTVHLLSLLSLTQKEAAAA